MNRTAKPWLLSCIIAAPLLVAAGCARMPKPAPAPTPIPTPPPTLAAPDNSVRRPDPVLLVGHGCSWRMSWSPDGSAIVYDYMPGELACGEGDTEALSRVSVGDAGSSPRKIWISEQVRYPVAPAWSPQGDWIAFSNYDVDNLAENGVYIIRPDGTDLTRLATEPGEPVWSPDGEWIAFAREAGVFRIRRDGTEKIRLPTPAGDKPDYFSNVSWSPDGSRLAYIYNGVIYVARADASEVINLTESAGLAVADWVAWSPVSDVLAFSSHRGGWCIFLVNADGFGLTELTCGSGRWRPIWSPDGRQIAFSTSLSGGLSIMNADGSGHLIGVDTGDCRPRFWSWSPDGEWIAFSCSKDAPGSQSQLYSWIYLVRVNPEVP